ncbi:hypothetical protein B0H19DRAFT_1268878 [Mycena capillaripes]|nr:hypothetical protein B0H19DRAFT_1268878 [Mycena capillaripes]
MAMCTGHSFPASTIIQWYRAPSSQRCSGRLAACGSSLHVCDLIDVRVPSHSTSGVYFSPTLIVLIPRHPTRVRPGYVAAAFYGYFSQAAFLSVRSLTRVPPVPVLYPVPRSRWSSSSLSPRTLPTLPS